MIQPALVTDRNDAWCDSIKHDKFPHQRELSEGLNMSLCVPKDFSLEKYAQVVWKRKEILDFINIPSALKLV